jgi:hypothetical protein
VRVLICGSRTWNDLGSIARVIRALPEGTTVICGGALGADSIAQTLAEARGLIVLTVRADWARHDHAAGPIRNQRMLDEGRPDRVIAFRMPGVSRGTDDMIRRATKAGIPVEVIGP